MPLHSEQEISSLLRRVRRIALTIASPKLERPSNRVLRFLLHEGYTVYPVNPRCAGQEIAGQRVYASLSEIPQPIDMVDVFRNSAHVAEIIDEALSLKVGAIWLQLGVEDAAGIAKAEKMGVQCVHDRCPAIDIPRLRAVGLL